MTELNLTRGDSTGASLVAQRLKHLPAMWETWVRFLGWEDPLEKEMAAYSSILAWRIPWREQPGRLQSTGLQKVKHDFTFTFTFIHDYCKNNSLDEVDLSWQNNVSAF